MKAALLGERYSLLWEKLGGIYIFASWSSEFVGALALHGRTKFMNFLHANPSSHSQCCATLNLDRARASHTIAPWVASKRTNAPEGLSAARDNHVAGVGLRDRKEPPLLTSTCRWVGCSRWSRPRVRARRSSTAHPWALDLQSEEQWEKHGGRRPRINHRETEQQRQQQQRHSAATSRSPVHMSCATFHGQILRGACRIISG